MSKWAEIRSDYIEQDGSFLILHIDAWETGQDDEEGKVIATIIGAVIDEEKEYTTIWIDKDAMYDPRVKEEIEQARRTLEDELDNL
ncbi:hypothetical protein [Bacillus phage SDFMU_Pbc]|uniref:Uncharacterized protein n=1 Tax=Bacillus phage SDFMU_Pbc TaxID=3076135 RepID=A0AA96R162_9CAUD|nr:hypothetical protein [Bacillus phage SDFMU_Pbc]